MPLAPGTRLGPYEVTAQIGVGGMGEVYQATDTKLKRQVAIKVLPESVAADKDRLARFQREAEVLASLNHPHIAQIHGLEDTDGGKALVMELVEGPTLADRIAQGAIPVDEAIAIARQIAEALEAAHEQGIIHRDLKPANVKVREDGTVKVLDFGLAKALEPVSASSPDISHSPTLTSPALSQLGVILGTAAYMSPEQAKGKVVDKRADIWAFGVVLFEMLTGKNAFPGEDVQEVLAGVINKEPDSEALPSHLDPRIQKLLRRCLRKDRKDRLHDIGDARVEIQEILAEPTPPVASEAAKGGIPLLWRALVALSGVLVIALLATTWILWPTVSAPGSSVRLSVNLGAGDHQLAPVGGAAVLSPDGKKLAFVGRRPGGGRQLYIRSLDGLEATPLSGTEGAFSPFFSPDGQWLAFFTPSALKKVSVSGGAALTIAEVPTGRGGTWGPDNTIVYASISSGLFRVPASGGTPVELTQLGEGESSHRWPWFLPNGKAVLFMVGADGRTPDDATIEAVLLDSGERKVLHRGGTYPRYASSGHLLYARESTLFAIPFDPDRIEPTGEPSPVIDGVRRLGAGVALFAVADNGSLVYVPGGSVGEASRELVRVDRAGNASLLTETRGDYESPRLSPDGQRLAVRRMATQGVQYVWILELSRGTLSKLTFDKQSILPVWSPNGERVFLGFGGEPWDIYSKPADGSGTPEQLTAGAYRVPTSITSDGKTIVFRTGGAGNNLDIGIVRVDGEGEPELILHTSFNEHTGKLSPDDKWLAYVSNESGRDEVYVTRFPPAGKWPISTDGGREPAWSRDGRELFYRNGEKMMAVTISGGPGLSPGKPTLLFEGSYDLKDGPGATNYDVTPDGRGFVMIRTPLQSEGSGTTQVILVQNWFEELKRLVPTK